MMFGLWGPARWFSCSSPFVWLAILIATCAVASGCSSRKSVTSSARVAADSQSSDNAASAAPTAKIHIAYSRPGDYLTSLVVTEYSGAETVLPHANKTSSASIVRFEGGIVVWQIAIQKRLLNEMPILGKSMPGAVTEVEYGTMPAGFTEVTPDTGTPEPLQPAHYYVFTVTRASGSTSYEAVKVNGDGALEAYQADPRAGSSFRLCCEVPAGFVTNSSAFGAGNSNEP